MRYQLNSRFRAVEAFVNQACSTDVPEEIRSYLFQLGAVLICGNVERSIEIIILSRLAHRAHPRVLNFVKSHFRFGTNFNCAAIEQLLNRFDPDWYRVFSKFTEENEDVKEGISSCYEVRNSVAHGGTMHVGSQRLKELLDVSRRLIDAVIHATS